MSFPTWSWFRPSLFILTLCSTFVCLSCPAQAGTWRQYVTWSVTTTDDNGSYPESEPYYPESYADFSGQTPGAGYLEIDAEVTFKWVWSPDFAGDVPLTNPKLNASGSVYVSWSDEDDTGKAETKLFATNNPPVPQPLGVNATGSTSEKPLSITFVPANATYTVAAGPFEVHGAVLACGCSGPGTVQCDVEASLDY